MSQGHFDNRGKGKIEHLNEKLYSRTRYRPPEHSREPISEAEVPKAREDWGSPDIDEILKGERISSDAHPFIRRIFIVSLLFFICAGLAAGLIYFKGDNFISTKNLDISVEGPVNISAGSTVDLDITITNKNNAALDRVVLEIEYPEGTKNASSTNKSLENTKETLEELEPGQRITRNERAVFLGAEGEVKSVKISVSYAVRGSNATFTKDKIFELTIGTAPINLSVTRPQVVSSGEEFVSTITIVSNSEETLKDVALRAEYPYGWAIRTANPAPFDKEKRVWLLGDLSPGEKKTITLRGTLLGQDDEERTFRFFVGVSNDGGESMDTVLGSHSVAIAIDRPTIDLDVKLNGETADEYVAPQDKEIRGVITFKNNLEENLTNPQLEVKLTGGALDKLTVKPSNGGFYNSANDTIVWNESNSGDIGLLTPGSSKSISFTFSSLENIPPGASNQKIDLMFVLRGRPQNASSEVRVTESRSVKIASEISLSARSFYSKGPLSNLGPIPPKAENETTYTITLSAINTRNDIKDVRVTGTLGANVNWAEEVYPSGSEVIFNEENSSIRWDIGTLQSGAGFSNPTREVSFKVSIMPSLGQVGGVPVLLGNIALVGTDAFTNQEVRITVPSVTTRISSDPSYVQGDEIVVK